ncbi:MAG: YggS family pyridoxal phosphate-dependent enzyme [Bacteroidetes bacterium]|nr:MAG: YggS family pyridoxal phosphate-dependent enzyme [Bacteroidota bacterium]
MNIKENFDKILKILPDTVKLVAVSKTKPNELIMQAYNMGYRIFGENKPQELKRKYDELPKDINWHMIGHLQTNKVKYIAPFVELIHAVDSIKLLKTINKEAIKNNRVINYLFQIHVAKEQSKFGLSCSIIEDIISSEEFSTLKNVNLVGLMAMATNTTNEELIANEFKEVKNCLNKLKSTFFADKEDFKELSIGMSQDYQIAVKQDSTMVRIGSLLFGSRDIV